MGGTGNTGQTPEKQAGVQDAITASGNAALPQWGAGAAAPGDVAAQGGLPALTEAPPTLRPYEEAVASTGTGEGPSTGLLAPQTGPMGFQHDPYPVAPTDVPTYGAAPPPAAAAAASGEFAAPTSFANPWDAGIGATQILNPTGMFNNRNWTSDPASQAKWLQAFADSGGDWRKTDTYYNPISSGGAKIYWPGDPARPK